MFFGQKKSCSDPNNIKDTKSFLKKKIERPKLLDFKN